MKKRFRFYTLMVLTSLSIFPVNCANAYWAVAYARGQNGAWAAGKEFNSASVDEATNSALEACRGTARRYGINPDGCAIVQRGINGCSALAIARNGNGYGSAATQRSLPEANSAAIAACTRSNPQGCVVPEGAGFCDGTNGVAESAPAPAAVPQMPPRSPGSQSDPRVAALTAAYNASGQDLLRQFSGKPGNFVFSPYSIGEAMGMALSGARNATELEMRQILKHNLNRQDMEAASKWTIATLNGYDNGAASSAKLRTANALMIVKPNVISRDYAALLRDNHGADVFQNVDIGQINDWVQRKTEGKIDRILDRLDPDPNHKTAVVLLNAVYFKAPWDYSFNKTFTRPEAFYISKSQQIQTPMMKAVSKARATIARQGYRAIYLPYAVRALGLVVVLPNEIDGLDDVIRSINADELAALMSLSRAPTHDVVLMLPRFKIEYKTDPTAQFKEAGMKLAFDDESADFSGMTGRPVTKGPRLKIGEIIHRAIIEVEEEGTEAAAVTAITGATPSSASTMRPPPPEIFRVDHPFLFYLVDGGTGAILFAGRMSNPQSAGLQ